MMFAFSVLSRDSRESEGVSRYWSVRRRVVSHSHGSQVLSCITVTDPTANFRNGKHVVVDIMISLHYKM
jgi:hypothetical protein